MENTPKPTLEELPTKAQLRRSSLIACGLAALLAIGVVLPAETGKDPIGLGRLTGLQAMGQIKSQLAEEAEQDRQAEETPAQEQAALPQRLFNLLISSAAAQEAEVWRDEISFTLAPGEGIEWKLVMTKDATAAFRWFTDQGRVNYDLHGDGGGRSISYQKGRGTAGEAGTLTAAFTGNHGWFWRNRDRKPVTVTVQLRGDYSALKRTY
ncbi:transmembrane anchor protein [Thalassovita sp.]|uniref:transmembrane anchor protein n=1 Tax=Thalassovita sp. TaxID=1979401 RepID=UPI002AB08066|nr:transmembrane anchor protein [Thalassovita sp.]